VLSGHIDFIVLVWITATIGMLLEQTSVGGDKAFFVTLVVHFELLRKFLEQGILVTIGWLEGSRV